MKSRYAYGVRPAKKCGYQMFKCHSSELPDALGAFAEAQLGQLTRTRFCGWPHAESAVWHLEGRASAYLKAFRQPRKFAQERRAYRDWLPRLTSEPGLAVTPALLAESGALRALLLSALPGSLAVHALLTPRQGLEVYRRAGAFLRALHALPFGDDDPLPLGEAYRQRAKAWLARAEGLVADPLVAWVGGRAGEAAGLLDTLGAARVPCHRDFTARNWLVATGAGAVRLAVIDFEHARPDFWLFDTEKLCAEVTATPLEAAFWQGYGRAPTDAERRVLEAHGALAALSTVVWAREHGDAAFEAQGRAQLGRLRARGR